MLVYCWFCAAEKAISAEPMVRSPWRELASLAAILAVRRLGTAIAAMMAIIATTIKSSTNEKPFSFFIIFVLSLLKSQLKVLCKAGWIIATCVPDGPRKTPTRIEDVQMFNPEKQIKTYFAGKSSHRKGWSRRAIDEGDEFHQGSAQEKPHTSRNIYTDRTTGE